MIPDMMACPHCGAATPNVDFICDNCGEMSQPWMFEDPVTGEFSMVYDVQSIKGWPSLSFKEVKKWRAPYWKVLDVCKGWRDIRTEDVGEFEPVVSKREKVIRLNVTEQFINIICGECSGECKHESNIKECMDDSYPRFKELAGEIKFSRCPVEPDKGKEWSKIVNLPDDAEFIIYSIDRLDSDEMSKEQIRKDTFQTWGVEEWKRLMRYFYRVENLYGILLRLTSLDTGERMTTFRMFTKAKYKHYSKMMDERGRLRIRLTYTRDEKRPPFRDLPIEKKGRPVKKAGRRGEKKEDKNQSKLF